MKNIYLLNLKKGFFFFSVALLTVFQIQGRTIAENVGTTASAYSNAAGILGDFETGPTSLGEVTFGDESFVYDGLEHSLAIKGTLPAGVTVIYGNNGRTNVGTQQVTATISGQGYPTEVLTATLTISPASITGITFEDDGFVYDGTPRSLAITGTLPVGTTVVYSNNGRTDVGTQQVMATISGSNYTQLILTAELTITPVAVPIFAFRSGSFVYDGTAKSLTMTGTLPVGTTVTYSNNSRTDVGTQKVSATISGKNYTPLILTADLTITEAAITGVTLEEGSFVYDGTVHSLAITGALPAGTSVAYSNNNLTDVGTKEVTATISGGNYAPLVLTANLTVTPATITGITLQDASFVYDGTRKSLAIEGTLPAGATVEYERNSRTNVGAHEVTATITGSNYIALQLTANLTVTKAPITGITYTDASFVYNGTTRTLSIIGELPAGATVAYSNNIRKVVGNQEATATISGSNFITLVLTANLAITPATITGFTLENGSFVYDGTPKSLEIAGTLSTGTTVTYADNSRTDVGSQKVTATITRSNHAPLVLTADLSITPASITDIAFSDESFVYDGQAKSLAIVGTIPAGTTVAYSDNSLTDVGTRKVTAIISGSNYQQLNLAANLTITPAAITGIGLEDGSFVYDGTAKSLEITGALPAEATVAYSNNSLTDVGVQEVTATITKPNFTTLVLSAGLTVTPATISGVAFEGASFVYDGTVHTLVIGGLLPTGTEVVYSDNSGKDAGTYEATATIAGSNYTPLVLTADLTIERKALFVVPDGDIFKYEGNNDPTLGYQVDGWVDGEGIGLVSGSLSRESGESIGQYPITLGSLDAGSNYVLEVQPTVFTIKIRYILSLQNPEMVSTAWNTSFDQVQKPASIIAELVDGSTVSVGVSWSSPEYNQLEAGVYSAAGQLALEGIENPQGFEVELLVLVEDKLPPTDIRLSKTVFPGDIQINTLIGTFSTVDAQDNVHSYQLVDPDQNDGRYFRLEGNTLYWNTNEALVGKTSFTIKVSSTDRKGNSIEREFTLTRSKISIDQIDMFTAFTPDGDGVNDTWGVPDLKYVQGGRVHVFDRSGRRIFYTEKAEIRWDGTFEGKEMPAGAYMWALELQETGEVRRGTLTLLKH